MKRRNQKMFITCEDYSYLHLKYHLKCHLKRNTAGCKCGLLPFVVTHEVSAFYL